MNQIEIQNYETVFIFVVIALYGVFEALGAKPKQESYKELMGIEESDKV